MKRTFNPANYTRRRSAGRRLLQYNRHQPKPSRPSARRANGSPVLITIRDSIRFTKALFLLAIPLGTAACGRTGNAPIPESSRVVHLGTNLPIEYRSAGDETRPVIPFPKTGAIAFKIPPGPIRVFRTALTCRDHSNGGEKVVATLNGDDPKRPHEFSVSLGGTHGWQRWEFDLPASTVETRIVLRLAPRTPQAEDVALAVPTLSRRRKRSPRVFILFDVDALRADHVSAYGYSRKTTPQIDHFFRGGTLWENAFSNVPWTLPSHVTMFSSTLPNEHGVGERSSHIPDNLPLLPEALQAAGYRTIAVTNGGYVDPSWGFERGFDVYHSSVSSVDKEVETAEKLIDSFAGDPIFLFFHTYQVHNYVPSGSGLRFFVNLQSLGPYWTRNPYVTLNHLIETYGEPRVKEWMTNRYDAALFGVDEAFAGLTRWISRRGLEDATAVLFTSDHGEEIFDRSTPSPDNFARFGHSTPYLYDEYLKVPLMLRVPWDHDVPKGRVDDNVSLLDLAPTLLDVLRVPVMPSFRGRSVTSKAARPGPETIVSKGPRFDALAVRIGDFKYIRRTQAPIESPEGQIDFGQLPPRECFDTSKDRGERIHVSCQQPKFDALKLTVENYLANQFPGSLVFRIGAGANDRSRSEYALEAESVNGLIKVRSFGLDKTARFWTEGGIMRARFKSGLTPVWVAIQPGLADDSVDVKLYADRDLILESPVTHRDTDGVFPWAGLGWRGRHLLPLPVTVFTTPPGRSARSRAIPTELVRRLSDLGYLASKPSDENLVLRGSTSDNALPDQSLLRMPKGMVRIGQPVTLPVWKAPPDPPQRQIERLEPSSVPTGSGFNTNADGASMLDVYGRNFRPNDWVYWELQSTTTTFVNSHHLRALIIPRYLDVPQPVRITVRDPFDLTTRPATAVFEVTARRP